MNDFFESSSTKNKVPVIILDNATKKRISEIKKLNQKNACTLMYTIPNSPELNYIENIFRILKKRVGQIQYNTK